MKKFKKFLTILAFMDLTDIVAKGHMLCWLKSTHPEAAKDYIHVDEEKNGFLKVRANMIDGVAGLFDELFDLLF